MQDLRLVGVTDDGHLMLRPVDGKGGEFRVAIDERLHAALRNDRARLGQLSHLEGELTPREIQSRVRSGESAESVAAQAGIPVERILRFAQPVLDERAHVADRARRGGVRRSTGETPTQTLDELLVGRLAGHVSGPDEVVVDAFRGDDGRWAVVTSWIQQDTPRRALWSFDASRTAVSPASEEARWLAGEADDPAARAPAAAGPGPGRLAVVPAGEGSHEAAAPGPAAGADPSGQRPAVDDSHDLEPDTAPVPVVRVPTARSGGAAARRPRVPPLVTHDTDPGRLRLSDVAPGAADAADDPASGEEPKAPGPHRKASVPSWDEIMFGRHRHD
jgi:hypothetical protein